MSHLDCLTVEHFSTLKTFKLSLAHRTRMPSFLHDRALVGICRWHGGLFYRQWFLEVFLSPFSNVNDRVMPMSWYSVALRPEDHGHPNKGLQPCPLHTEISLVFWIFWWCYACRWWDLQKPLQFDIEATMLLKYSHNYFYALFHRLESSAHLTSERLCSL